MKEIAVISAFNKNEKLLVFARGLKELGMEIWASRGSAAFLNNFDVPAVDIASKVGEPILGHQVVTLDRGIYCKILGRPERQDELAELKKHGNEIIRVVRVDLYPTEETIAKTGATLADVLDNMDIGGPTLLSAASKRRIAVCDEADHEPVLKELRRAKDAGQPFDPEFREILGTKADFFVSWYRSLTANFRGPGRFLTIHATHLHDCAYGENHRQTPARVFTIKTGEQDPLRYEAFKHVGGSSPSYNNNLDLMGALRTVTELAATWKVNFGEVPYIAVAVKHTNPCGVGVGAKPEIALKKAIDGNRKAIFGGCLMVNFPITNELALVIRDYNTAGDSRRILDAVIASSFDDEAIKELERAKGKCRFFENGKLAELDEHSLYRGPLFAPLWGAIETQPSVPFILDLKDTRIVRHGDKLTPQQERDMLIARVVCGVTTSNTISLAKDDMLKGNGAGQQSRVIAARVALMVADDGGHNAGGAVGASDSFFPAPDGPEVLAKAGIGAMFTTSGSRRDDETIAVFNWYRIPLVMLPDVVARGFRH